MAYDGAGYPKPEYNHIGQAGDPEFILESQFGTSTQFKTKLDAAPVVKTAEQLALDAGRAAKPLGLGSTGRSVANNLREQFALEQAMSNPAADQVLRIAMTDPRWPASDG